MPKVAKSDYHWSKLRFHEKDTSKRVASGDGTLSKNNILSQPRRRVNHNYKYLAGVAENGKYIPIQDENICSNEYIYTAGAKSKKVATNNYYEKRVSKLAEQLAKIDKKEKPEKKPKDENRSLRNSLVKKIEKHAKRISNYKYNSKMLFDKRIPIPKPVQEFVKGFKWNENANYVNEKFDIDAGPIEFAQLPEEDLNQMPALKEMYDRVVIISVGDDVLGVDVDEVANKSNEFKVCVFKEGAKKPIRIEVVDLLTGLKAEEIEEEGEEQMEDVNEKSQSQEL